MKPIDKAEGVWLIGLILLLVAGFCEIVTARQMSMTIVLLVILAVAIAMAEARRPE